MTPSSLARLSRVSLAAALAIPITFLAGCSRGAAAEAARDAAPSAVPPASGSAPAPGCAAQFDVLVPFQKYGESDLIRAIVVDGADVYFRTYHETYRVPLAGGAPTLLTKATGDGPLWVLGDRLVTQPTGQPAFLEMPKTGGSWTPFLDATAAKHSGGQSVPTRIFQSIGSGRIEGAREAIFDGTHFQWLEEDTVGASLGSKGKTTWHVRRIAAAGGAAETLYTSLRELRGLVVARDRLLFEEEVTPEAKLPPGAKKPLLETRIWSLLSMPAAGGKAEVRMNPSFGVNSVSDGALLYLSGFRSLSEGGMWRMPVAGNAPPERIDPLVIEQRWGLGYGNGQLVFFSPSMTDAPRTGHVPDLENYLLTGPAGGSHFERSSCIAAKYGVHAQAVSGKSLLLSLFIGAERTAGIVKVALP